MPSQTSVLQLPPLSLYIHIPWCVQKCPYCDFNSHQAEQKKHALDEQRYINTLKHDLTVESQFSFGRKLTSIFFGGGTPSIFSAQGIAEILQHAEHFIGFSDDIEITLEANPGTFEQEKFSGFYAAGVNRLSIGVQSFNTDHLRILGRIHNSDEATNAVKIAKKAGFSNINIDIMHGLPGQSLAQAIDDVRQAIACTPQHISWYQLTIEPNTAFYRQPPQLPHDDILADIQDRGAALLAKNGFEQYEISAFSQPRRQSQHNINYWQFGDYLGVGAGAHGKITDCGRNTIIRRQKTRLPDHYMQHSESPKTQQTDIDIDERPLEFMMNALRLTQGVPTAYFAARTGLPFESIIQKVAQLQHQKLLENLPSQLKTTALGQRFLNTVLEKLSEEIVNIDALTLPT
ncbi:MAG: putative oxygen-independent coproporphyrinogen III oxidase [Candidatus Endobugula sp.]|jgi:putative oxygen-independent coproporphyrinogen III oxidase